jgi:hypothetical protein
VSLDSTFPLIAFARDYSITLEIELEGDVSGDVAETFTITASGVQMYGTTGGSLAAPNTVLADLETAINSSAFATDFPGWAGASFAWQHGPARPSLRWSLSIDLGEAAVGGTIQPQAPSTDLRELGIYSSSISATAAGNTLTFEAEWTPAGVWAPCMPCELQDPDREYVQRTQRNPRDLARFSRIQHARNMRRVIPWRDVSGFHRDSYRQALSSYQQQAAFEGLTGDPASPTLETMLDAWADGGALQLWTGAGVSYDVDLDFADTFAISDFATPSSAGGSRFDLDLPLVDV